MARSLAFLLALLLLAIASPAVLARRPSHRPRRLNGYSYGSPSPSSGGSSPTSPTPSTPSSSSPSSGSSPSAPYTSPSTPSSSSPPSGSSPSAPYTSPSTPSSSSPSSGSSPSAPYTSPSTPSSSSPSTPSSSSPSSGSSPSAPYTSPPTTPSSSSPVTVPPVTTTPSPVTIPPVTSSPSGGYGGYGSRSGSGTSGFWRKNAGRVPKILSLLSTLAKIFGGRALKIFGGKLSLFGAIQNMSMDSMSSLAREGTASLINAYAYDDFPLAASDVIDQFNNALDSDDAAAGQAAKFQQFNEAL